MPDVQAALYGRFSLLPTGRFHDIAWGRSNDEYSKGIIAGALENGSLDLWNGGKLMSGERFGSEVTLETMLDS